MVLDSSYRTVSFTAERSVGLWHILISHLFFSTCALFILESFLGFIKAVLSKCCLCIYLKYDYNDVASFCITQRLQLQWFQPEHIFLVGSGAGPLGGTLALNVFLLSIFLVHFHISHFFMHLFNTIDLSKHWFLPL